MYALLACPHVAWGTALGRKGGMGWWHPIRGRRGGLLQVVRYIRYTHTHTYAHARM